MSMKDTESIKKLLFNYLGLNMKALRITINFPELGLQSDSISLDLEQVFRSSAQW